MAKTMIINGGTISVNDYGKITIDTTSGKEINLADAIISLMKQCGCIRTSNFYDRYKMSASISIALIPSDETVKIFNSDGSKDEYCIDEFADALKEAKNE